MHGRAVPEHALGNVAGQPRGGSDLGSPKEVLRPGAASRGGRTVRRRGVLVQGVADDVAVSARRPAGAVRGEEKKGSFEPTFRRTI